MMEEMRKENISCDVLVCCGGIAGILAAIRAKIGRAHV